MVILLDPMLLNIILILHEYYDQYYKLLHISILHNTTAILQQYYIILRQYYVNTTSILREPKMGQYYMILR